jgi:hypothetical protein
MVSRLISIALLALLACTPLWQGSPIEPASPGWAWLAEVDDLAADWRADPALPSIDTPCPRSRFRTAHKPRHCYTHLDSPPTGTARAF